MAIGRAEFGHTRSSSVSSASVTLTGWAAGDSCLVGIHFNVSGTTISSVTLAGESNPTLAPASAQTGGPNNGKVQFAYLSNVTGSGSKQLTVNTSASCDISVEVWRLTGADTSGMLDTTAGASGSSTTPSVSITTANANEAIFAIGTSDGSDPSGVASGYTDETGILNSSWYDFGIYNLDVGTAGSKTPSCTISSGTWCWLAIAVKPAGGAAATRGTPFGQRGTAFGGGRGFYGIVR